MDGFPIPLDVVFFTLCGLFAIKTFDFAAERDRRRWEERRALRVKCLETAASVPLIALTAAAEGRVGNSVDPALHAAICQLRIYGAGARLLDCADEILAALIALPPDEPARAARTGKSSVAVDQTSEIKQLMTRVHTFTTETRQEFRTGADTPADE